MIIGSKHFTVKHTFFILFGNGLLIHFCFTIMCKMADVMISLAVKNIHYYTHGQVGNFYLFYRYFEHNTAYRNRKTSFKVSLRFDRHIGHLSCIILDGRRSRRLASNLGSPNSLG